VGYLLVPLCAGFWGPQSSVEQRPGSARRNQDLEAGGRAAGELRGQGITRDRHVILYCNTGTEATDAYFALENLLGYPNVDVYFPSWTESAERMDLPIETLATSR
jgi:3-mercaptopyruvate sulfurtransferase SseA